MSLGKSTIRNYSLFPTVSVHILKMNRVCSHMAGLVRLKRMLA